MIDSWVPPITDVVETPHGVRIFLGEWPGEPPTLVFAPGLTGQHRHVAAVAACLAGRVRVVSLDLRGRGLSSKPAPGRYGIEQHARDVLAVMNAIGLDQAILAGHSMGAYVATAVATAAPERAAGLVLIDGGVYVIPPGAESLDLNALLEARIQPLLERLDGVYATPGEYIRLLETSPYFEGCWGPIAESSYLYELGLGREGYTPKCDRRAAEEDWADLTKNPATQSRLEAVRCPVLAVAAEWGLSKGDLSVLSDFHRERLREAVGEHDFLRVPGTTHHTLMLSEEGARPTAEAIATFVARVAR